MRIITLLALVLGLAVVPPAEAEEPADSIRDIIVSQLSAFQRNDLAAAFSHASPGIQATFRTPDNFGRMVREGYPMIWRPARHRMLELRETPRGPVQVVLFEDQAGRIHEADYLMEEVGGVWRIDGVRLRALPGLGA